MLSWRVLQTKKAKSAPRALQERHKTILAQFWIDFGPPGQPAATGAAMRPLWQQCRTRKKRPVELPRTMRAVIAHWAGRPVSGAPFKIGTTIEAVAALGNPNRFFKLLNELPYQIQAHSYPDHYRYKIEDFQGAAFADGNPIVLTKKDGIKCEAFADSRFWCLDVKVEVDPELLCHVSKHVLQFVDP